jgi:hypothetical protein
MRLGAVNRRRWEHFLEKPSQHRLFQAGAARSRKQAALGTLSGEAPQHRLFQADAARSREQAALGILSGEASQHRLFQAGAARSREKTALGTLSGEALPAPALPGRCGQGQTRCLG